MHKYRYTVSTSRSPRGTAGAASRIPLLKSIVEEVGGEVIETYVAGPYLYADVSMTHEQAQALRAYPDGLINDVYQRHGGGD